MVAWNRWHPQDIFPSLWGEIEKLIIMRAVLVSDEVMRELKRKDDALLRWVKTVGLKGEPPTQEIQLFVQDIMREFPRMVDSRTGKSAADPFVIATAKITSSHVVTSEHVGKANRPTIPTVCNHFQIPCCNLIDVMRAEEWEF